MSKSYNYKDGRVWLQDKKFEPYKLLLPYGITGVTDPLGTLTPVREPSSTKRGRSVIVDVIRGEPGLPEFQIETRLKRTLNYMLGLGDCTANYQGHLGACGRPDEYAGSEIMLHWERVHRGDMAIDRISQIEGDDSPDAMTVPQSAEVGPLFVDFGISFLSSRTISEDQLITGYAFLESECLIDCQTQIKAGEIGYLGTEADTGVAAVVHYTTDKGENWSAASADPFAADEDISAIAISGNSTKHRVIVARGTTDGSNPAEIAYADITTPGTTSWVNVNVGSVDGQVINDMAFLSFGNIFAVTDDGYIYRSKNGGVSWSAVRSGGAGLHKIRGVAFGQNAGLVVAVGDAGTILLSQDYGETWDAKSGPSGFYADNITALEVTPDGTILIGDEAGELAGSYDLCDNWTSLTLSGITATDVNDIRAWGDSIIFVAANISGPAGKVLRSTDGGATFELWNLNTPSNTGCETLALVDPNICWVGGAAGFVTKTQTQLIGL